MDLVFSRTKKIPNRSWGQECSLCSSRHGVPIQCSARDCKAAYHTTCAIRAKLKMQAIFGKNYKGGIKLRSYCKDHCPVSDLENGSSSQDDKIDSSGVKEIDMTNLADDRFQEGNEELDYFWKYVDINEVQKNLTESLRRSKKLKSKQAVDSAIDDVSPKKSKKSNNSKQDASPSKKNSPSKKQQNSKGADTPPSMQEIDPIMIDLIYRYWMLLRTANNGQSLIKFSPSALKEKEFEQRKNIMKLRIELERVRNLSYMIGKREKLKSSWLKTHQNIIRRTFNIINDLDPPQDALIKKEAAGSEVSQLASVGGSTNISLSHPTNGRRNVHLPTHHLQQSNGIFDESDQLLNDLMTCDQIYDLPASSTNSNHSNLSYQERSTLERRRTLSLVRRINRQLKSVNVEPLLNPYAKSYLIPKRSDSPANAQQQQHPHPTTTHHHPSRALKNR